jgi:(S)-ureidoglycine aminohydrolase
MKAICLAVLLQCTVARTLIAQNNRVHARVYTLDALPVIKDSSRTRVQFMDGSTNLMANLEAHLTILQPGQAAHPPHIHADTEELIIVKEGQITVTIAGKSKQLGVGGLALSLPGDVHGAVNTGKKKAAYYVIKYTKPLVDTARGIAAGGSLLMDWPEPVVVPTGKGERRQFFNRPTALFDTFDMHVTTLRDGELSHPPHTHRQEEIIIVKEGNVTMQIDDKVYPARPGDLIFLSSGIPHALQNTGKTTTTYFAFQWQ